MKRRIRNAAISGILKSSVLILSLPIVAITQGQPTSPGGQPPPMGDNAGLALPQTKPGVITHQDGSTTTISPWGRGTEKITTDANGAQLSSVIQYPTYDGGKVTKVATGNTFVTVEYDSKGTVRHVEKMDRETGTQNVYEYNDEGKVGKVLIYRPNDRGDMELQDGYLLRYDIKDNEDRFFVDRYNKENAAFNKEHEKEFEGEQHPKRKIEFESVVKDPAPIAERLNKEASDLKSSSEQFAIPENLPPPEELVAGAFVTPTVTPTTSTPTPTPPMDICLIGTWTAISLKQLTGRVGDYSGGTGFKITFEPDGTQTIDYSGSQPWHTSDNDSGWAFGGTATGVIETENGVAKTIKATTGGTLTFFSKAYNIRTTKPSLVAEGALGSSRGANSYTCNRDTLTYQASYLGQTCEVKLGRRGRFYTPTPKPDKMDITPHPWLTGSVSPRPGTPPPITPPPEVPTPTPKSKSPAGGAAGKPQPAATLQQATPAVSQSPAATVAASPTAKPTASAIPLLSPPGPSPSPSLSPQISAPPSLTSPSPSAQPGVSATSSPIRRQDGPTGQSTSRSPSVSPQASKRPSASPQQSRTPSPSPSVSPTPSASASTSSSTSSSDVTRSATPTPSETVSSSESERAKFAPLPVAQAGYGGGEPIAHDPGLPLLIYAGPFAYSLSYRVRLVNAEPTTAAAPQTPSISFSSDKEGAFSVLLSFEVRDEAGNVEQVVVRPLRSAQDLEPPLALEHLPPELFRFGIDPAELAKLKPGKHFIRAVFSPEKGVDTGSASASTQTSPLIVELKSSGLTSEQRMTDLQQAARFYLRDRDYVKAEELADKARALDGLSVGAWELRGEALLAQNKLEQAEEALKTALRNTKRASQLGVSSPQEESADRISKYLEKIRALRKTKKR